MKGVLLFGLGRGDGDGDGDDAAFSKWLFECELLLMGKKMLKLFLLLLFVIGELFVIVGFFVFGMVIE